MAAIREMFLNEKNRFDLVAIPKEEKGGLSEKDAIVLCRYDTEGANWDGELKLSGHWESVRGSMEANVKEFTDHDLVAAGVADEAECKTHIAVRESKWHHDHDKAWDKMKQDPTFVNQSPKKYRVQLKDREGWWNVTKKGTPAPFEVGQYALFTQAVEEVRTATELNIDKPGGLIILKPFAKNREEKLKAMIGKCVRWELRPTPIA